MKLRIDAGYGHESKSQKPFYFIHQIEGMKVAGLTDKQVASLTNVKRMRIKIQRFTGATEPHSVIENKIHVFVCFVFFVWSFFFFIKIHEARYYEHWPC